VVSPPRAAVGAPAAGTQAQARESARRDGAPRDTCGIGFVTACEVNPGVCTRLALAERLGPVDSPSRRFLRDILSGRKTWVAGATHALRPIAAASDVRLTGGALTACEPGHTCVRR
jgi:hypothetical protein